MSKRMDEYVKMATDDVEQVVKNADNPEDISKAIDKAINDLKEKIYGEATQKAIDDFADKAVQDATSSIQDANIKQAIEQGAAVLVSQAKELLNSPEVRKFVNELINKAMEQAKDSIIKSILDGKGLLGKAKEMEEGAKAKYEEMKNQADDMMEQGKKALEQAKQQAQGLPAAEAEDLMEKGNSMIEKAKAAQDKAGLMGASSDMQIQMLKNQVEEKFAAMTAEGQQVMDSAAQAAEDVTGKINFLDPISGANPLDPPKPTLAPMAFDAPGVKWAEFKGVCVDRDKAHVQMDMVVNPAKVAEADCKAWCAGQQVSLVNGMRGCEHRAADGTCVAHVSRYVAEGSGEDGGKCWANVAPVWVPHGGVCVDGSSGNLSAADQLVHDSKSLDDDTCKTWCSGQANVTACQKAPDGTCIATTVPAVLGGNGTEGYTCWTNGGIPAAMPVNWIPTPGWCTDANGSTADLASGAKDHVGTLNEFQCKNWCARTVGNTGCEFRASDGFCKVHTADSVSAGNGAEDSTCFVRAHWQASKGSCQFDEAAAGDTDALQTATAAKVLGPRECKMWCAKQKAPTGCEHDNGKCTVHSGAVRAGSGQPATTTCWTRAASVAPGAVAAVPGATTNAGATPADGATTAAGATPADGATTQPAQTDSAGDGTAETGSAFKWMRKILPFHFDSDESPVEVIPADGGMPAYWATTETAQTDSAGNGTPESGSAFQWFGKVIPFQPFPDATPASSLLWR